MAKSSRGQSPNLTNSKKIKHCTGYLLKKSLLEMHCEYLLHTAIAAAAQELLKQSQNKCCFPVTHN